MKSSLRIGALCGAALLLGACQALPDLPRSEGGTVTLTGRRVLARARTLLDSDTNPTVEFAFDHAYYSCTGRQTATFVLFQGDEDNPSAALTCRVLWRPSAGKTPIADEAGNATLHVMRFGAASVEVWEGAGFVFLKDEPKHPTMVAQCWNADVILKDASTDIKDTLGPATAEGRFTATYAPDKVEALIAKLSRKTGDKLGYPRLVLAQPNPR